MNIAEMNLLAGGYDITVKKVDGLGVYLLDNRSNRYQKLCKDTEYRNVTKDKLMTELRYFTNKLHHRTQY